MNELLDKSLQVGDLVIPLITHTGKLVEQSLFGLVIGSKEVFMYDEKTQTYKKKICSKCYKMEIDDNIKRNQLYILKREYNIWIKQEKSVLKNDLVLGDVLYKENKDGNLDYYIYLGRYRITLFNMYNEILKNIETFNRYNYCYLKFSSLDNITLLDSLIKKEELVNLSYLLFGPIGHSIFNKSIIDMLYVKPILLKGLYKYGHLCIDGIDNKSLLATNSYLSDIYEGSWNCIYNASYRIRNIQFDREK